MTDELWARIERLKNKQPKQCKERAPSVTLDKQTDKKHNAPLPRTFTRVSPFYPLRQADLKNRPYIEDMVLIKNAWGNLVFDGPKLSIFDEDCLLAILALIDKSQGQVTNDKFTYKGPLLPVLRLMGYKSPNIGKTNYTRVKKALKRMNNSSITVELKNGSWAITPFLEKAEWDEQDKVLTVTCNKYFYEQFIEGNITLLDVIERAKLKKPTSKALYRFTMSHKGRTWQGHFITLAKTLNLDIERPKRKIRDTLKRAIDELIKAKIITNQSKFISREIIYLERCYKALK